MGKLGDQWFDLVNLVMFLGVPENIGKSGMLSDWWPIKKGSAFCS
jgi:hypothetical protein